jgi:nitrite reductase/ring-hydroxylating ferredoxin subunit
MSLAELQASARPVAPWVRNAWYVVAWDHEIPAASSASLFRRIVLGEPLLVYRRANEGVVTLADRCCHRHAPLSAGRREGDCVRCGYHGLLFDAQGRCVEIPGLDQPPARARVRCYPTTVHRGWVMVWMGDPDLADPALLPDNFSCEHPEWRHEPGYLHYDTPWTLIADNLLDFSHISYVHAATLGGTDRIAKVRPTVRAIDRGVRVQRRVPSVPPPAYYRPLWNYQGLIDRWIDYTFTLPGVLLMHSGARPAGAPEDDLTSGIRFHSCQALTPETAHSTHYFFQESHRADQGDENSASALFQGLLQAFNEDRDMISAQWRNLALASGDAMLPLAMDSALTLFRRALDAAVAREAAPLPRPATAAD